MPLCVLFNRNYSLKRRAIHLLNTHTYTDTMEFGVGVNDNDERKAY